MQSDHQRMDAPNSQEILRSDHARLDALFEELLDDFADGRQREIRSTWTEFDRSVLVHLDTEERFILPLFERVNPEETAALRAEHARIRRLLGELGVGVDLHLVRLEMAREFIGLLRAHARREDLLLYRWAASDLEEAARVAVTQKLLPALPGQGEACTPPGHSDHA